MRAVTVEYLAPARLRRPARDLRPRRADRDDEHHLRPRRLPVRRTVPTKLMATATGDPRVHRARRAPRRAGARRVPRAGHGIRGVISTSVTYGYGNGSSWPATSARTRSTAAAARSWSSRRRTTSMRRDRRIVGGELLLVAEFRRPPARTGPTAPSGSRHAPSAAGTSCQRREQVLHRRAAAGPRGRACSRRGRGSRRPQHAMDLGQRPVLIEPVERLRDRDEGGRAVVERDRLGRAVHHLADADERAHLGDRLDRD